MMMTVTTMMMMMRAMLMFVCFLMINAQSTTDLDQTLTTDHCTLNNQGSTLEWDNVQSIQDEENETADASSATSEKRRASSQRHSVTQSEIQRQYIDMLDFIQSLLSPQQHDIHLAVSILEDTSRQVKQVVNNSQTLQRGLAEVKEEQERSSQRFISESESTQELLKQMKDSVNNISARMTSTTCPASTSTGGDQKQQLVSALTERCIPLLIQQNINGSNFFNRSWEEFKVGFNDTNGNYWLGNELLSQLTLTGPYKLRFELQSRANQSNWYFAEYSTFIVLSESSNYMLHVAGYSGNARRDALSYQNGQMFTTYDRDNDPWTHTPSNNNCAVYRGGGFWYKDCALCSVNTVRGIRFSWSNLPGGNHLQSSRMWLQCR